LKNIYFTKSTKSICWLSVTLIVNEMLSNANVGMSAVYGNYRIRESFNAKATENGLFTPR